MQGLAAVRLVKAPFKCYIAGLFLYTGHFRPFLVGARKILDIVSHCSVPELIRINLSLIGIGLIATSQCGTLRNEVNQRETAAVEYA